MGVFTHVSSLVCQPKELIADSSSPSDFKRSLLRLVLLLMQTQEVSPSNAFSTLKTNTSIFTDTASLMVRKVIVLLEAFTTLDGVVWAL